MPTKCSDAMNSIVEQCSVDESVESVIVRLRAASASFLAVCDAAGALVGAVSEREYALETARVRAVGGAPHANVIGAIMSNDLICCAPEDDVATARELMSRFGRTRVVCVDRSLRPVGSITGQELLHVDAYRTRKPSSSAS